jgi:hypothetical protein
MANKWSDRPYAVGKGKPPEHTRFGNGQATNRGGRRKGSKNADTLLREALDQTITITENGKERKISKLQASIMQLANQAAMGELKAFVIVMQQLRELNAQADPAVVEPLKDEDRRILEEIAAQMAHRPGDGQ